MNKINTYLILSMDGYLVYCGKMANIKNIYTGCTVNEFRMYTGNCSCIAHVGHLYYAGTAEIKHCTRLVSSLSEDLACNMVKHWTANPGIVSLIPHSTN